ncbi:MAG TPA: DNA-binding protein [Thermoanaerobaculia bacterium]
MRKLLVFTALLTLSTATLFAQPRGRMNHMNGMWDPQTVQAVSGTIVSVDRIKTGRPMGGGIHLTLQTATDKLDVALGPSWYIDELKTTFAAGDVIDVKGSLVDKMLVAAEVKKGADTITLRDVNGVPVWAGPRCR